MVLEYISFGSLKHLNSCLLGIFDPVICFTIFLSLEKLKHLMCVFLAETTFCLPNFTSFSPARSWRHVSIWTVCVWLVLCNLKEHFLANNDLATNGSAARGGSPGSATILAYFLPMKNSRTGIYVLLESSQPGIRAAWLWGGCLLCALQDASDGPALCVWAGSWGKQEKGVGLLPVLLGRGTACWWERAWIPGSTLRLLALTLFPSVCSLIIYCLLLPLFISSSWCCWLGMAQPRGGREGCVLCLCSSLWGQ